MATKSVGIRGVVLIASVFVIASAAGDGKGKGGKSGTAPRAGTQISVGVFADRDRDVICGFYASPAGGLPPGLAKRGGNLPPGQQKQLLRKGQMPPGLEKRFVPFPLELERQLSPLRSGLRRGIIDGRAVIVDERVSTIIDVMVAF